MNKVEKIKAEIERRKNQFVSQAEAFHKIGKEDKESYYAALASNMNSLSCFLDSLEEEPVSNDLEEAARKAATWHSRVRGDEFFPNDYQKFIAGAQWQKKQLIDKACEWLKSYRQDTPDGTGYIPGIINDETIEDFKKAMEE